jgi:DNA repair exonuclease SbcCD ATPase subunit
MNLKKIKISNFKKIGKEVTFVIKPGLNLIRSDINGTGKTTLLSAITFLLWNKNGDTKGNSKSTLSTTELINDINKKELLVEGYFDNGYIVRRGLKPNIFEIIDENGNNLADRSSKTIDQEFLETELLGYNYETFMSTIFLNSKPNSIPFIYMSNTQRKEYIEKILDLRVIYYLNENLKTKISANKSEIQDCSKSIEFNKENQKMLGTELARQRQIQENQKLEILQFQKNKENQIQNNRNIIESLKTQILEIQNKNTTLESNLESGAFTDQITANIESIQKEIAQIENSNVSQSAIQEYVHSKLSLTVEINNIKDLQECKNVELESLKSQLETLQTELKNQDEESLRNTLKLIDTRTNDLRNELVKKETEKNIHFKNKDNYSVCGECSTLSKIIGSFNIEEYDNYISKSELVKEQLQLKYSETESKIDSLSSLKNNIYDKKEQLASLNTEINTIQNLIGTKESEIDKIDFKIKELELNQKQQIQDKENQIIGFKKDIETIKERISTAIENSTREIQDKESQIKTTEINIQSINAQEPPTLIEINERPLKDCDSKIIELENLYDLLNAQKTELDSLKESINSKNIKEQALKSYIPLFEDKVNALISRFTEDDMFTIKAKLTEDFDIAFTKNGKPLNMFSLSEGQKASITFAFTFAFQFLLDTKNQIKESTLFIDEILDIALSSGRLNTIIEYLKEVSSSASGKSVYIISHNHNLQLELFDSIIDVTIENGFSKYTFDGETYE